ncbi:hypothetical protein KMW28_27460 [Flammeovirga yaeyamensis]|uniref:Carbohydrate esterase 2 N-terminal domain-containing protein n=1 Tax=Flammeovirga yaeyamensis TaxID=367791 RepID=A0AAX1NDZ1_9BACT|nr:hypothetical protein [Flammeovirga yaeyamensis]MBB3699978.1 hypothetical protein [Flammeovirga yaeyamensis]NMF37583.1 hypothetical protein [Flammeovirga yaeyamensis]QWG04640.1 hypothetical protein KMW28_27460 [Flammeovirga yaeyamensis]
MNWIDLAVIEGRCNYVEDAIEVYWPGTSITFNIKGESLKLQMSDDVGESEYLVLVNGIEDHQFIVDKDTTYTVWKSSKVEEATITLHRLNDFSKGTTKITLAELNGDLLEGYRKQKVITYYGNSITVGYANKDTTGNDNPLYTNNYYAYSSLTSRRLSAEQFVIARSGIGVMASWGDYIMPQIYNRVNPKDATTKWDFNKDKTNLVVINLLQNDAWLRNYPDLEQSLKWFGRQQVTDQDVVKAYQNFILNIRKSHPNASIICVLGCMDIVKEEYNYKSIVDQAVSEIKDERIYRLDFPYLASNAHPDIQMHKEMSDILVDYIKEHQLL